MVCCTWNVILHAVIDRSIDVFDSKSVQWVAGSDQSNSRISFVTTTTTTMMMKMKISFMRSSLISTFGAASVSQTLSSVASTTHTLNKPFMLHDNSWSVCVFFVPHFHLLCTTRKLIYDEMHRRENETKRWKTIQWNVIEATVDFWCE